MSPLKYVRRIILCLCVLSLVNLQIAPVQAAMIGTDELVRSAERDLTVNQVMDLLDRAEIQQELVAMGVDSTMARDRISQLTDEELQHLAGTDELPVGSGVAGIAVTVFIVLVITDVIGATDIFPFIKSINK